MITEISIGITLLSIVTTLIYKKKNRQLKSALIKCKNNCINNCNVKCK